MKKMKKLLLCSVISVLSISANAQFIRSENESEVKADNVALQKLKNISSINALLVGYGFYCRVDETKIQVIHSTFQSNVVNKLSEDNKKVVLDNYEEKVKLAREKGPGFSSMTCENIYDEYGKILAINKQDGNSIKAKIYKKEETNGK